MTCASPYKALRSKTVGGSSIFTLLIKSMKMTKSQHGLKLT